MPQTVDRIDFAFDDVEPGQWPKLSCGGGNLLQLNAGSLQLEADRALLFQGNGQLRAIDDNHRLVFNRTGNLLELHEAGDIRFLTGAPTPTEKLRIRADGTVGIGTNTPGAMLHVTGAIRTDGGLRVTGDTEVTGKLTVTGTTNLGGDTQVTGNLRATGIVDAAALHQNGQPFVGSNWEKIAGDIRYTQGNVGIGASTPAPYKLKVEGGDTYLSGALTVDGAVRFAATLTPNNLIWENNGAAIHYGNRGLLGATPTFNPDNDTPGLWIEGSSDGESGGLFMNGSTICLWSPGDNDLLRVYDEDDFSSPRFVLNGSGFVGIGTPAPQGALDVRGDIRAGNSDLYFTKTDHIHTGIGNTAGWAAIENAADYNALMILGRAGTTKGRNVRLWDYLQVNGSMDITGNFGIGTATPAVKMHVVGNRIRLTKASNGSHFIDLRADGSALDIEAFGGDLYINNTSGTFTRIRNFVNISTRETKEKITDLPQAEAAALLTQLRPVKFQFKQDPNQQQNLGFIAEEVPTIIATPDQKAYKPTDLLAILTSVVQSQQAMIATLQQQVLQLTEQATAP